MSREKSKKKEVDTVSKKGRATIPKVDARKASNRQKGLAVDTQNGVMLVPLPDPSMERGSLKEVLRNRSSKEIMREIRRQEEYRIFEKRKK